MTAFLRKFLFTSAAAVALSSGPEAPRADMLNCTPEVSSTEPLQLTPGIAVSKTVPCANVAHPYGFVGDPNVADIAFGPQNIFLIVGKKEGLTNVVVLDAESGTEIYRATLSVGAGRKVSVTLYSGNPPAENYLCGKSGCVSSDVATVTPDTGEKTRITGQTTITH